MAIFLPALAALVFICVFTYWQFGIAYEHLPPRLSGEDGAPKKTVDKVDKSIEATSGVSAIVKNEKKEEELLAGINTDAAEGKLVVIRTMPEGAILEKGNGKPGQTKDSWPCFRGVRRDAIANDSTDISRVWPESGPPVVWELELGQGYAGAAVRDGRVYIFDYDEVKKRDVIRCLSFDKGEEIWSYSYPMDIKRNHGISRTVVALDGKFLIGIGPKCQVTCLNSDTGSFLWRMDLVEQLGTAVPGWYAGQCPLIEDGKLILAPGAPEVLLTAIDCASGDVIWKTPNPHGSKMSHASVVPMLYKGKQTYIYAGTKGVVGVSATDGAIIWETQEFKWHTIAPSPVPVGEDRVLFTAGYGGDAKLAQLVEVDGKVQAKIIKIAKPREFGSEQHTPIFYKGFIYAVLPKPRQELVCMDTDLNEVWASGSPNRFGIGPYMIAGGLIFLMNDDGVLTMAEASEKEYVQLAQAKVLPGPDSWGPMVFVDGKLIVRDLDKMRCLDLFGGKSSAQTNLERVSKPKREIQ
jgi:outer membrane protein assembly factor BamB